MGRIWNKIKNGFKKAGRWVWGKVLKPAGKWIADKGLKIGKFVTDAASFLPGAIGKAAGLASKGISAAQAAINAIPKGKVKDKLQQGLDKASDAKAKAEDAANKVAGVANKVAAVTNTVIDTGKNAVSAVKQVL